MKNYADREGCYPQPWWLTPSEICIISLYPTKAEFVNAPRSCMFRRGGGGLIAMGGLFILEKTMVSVLHKELEYEVKKLINK